MRLTFVLKEKELCFDLRKAMWAVPTISNACVRACMCRGWCLCGCGRIRVFTQLEEQSGITSPSSSWGVCCHPIKRQTGSGTHSRNPEDFTCWNIPTFKLKGQARSLQTGWIYLEKGGREQMRLSLNSWSLIALAQFRYICWAQFPLHSSFHSDPDLCLHRPLLSGSLTSSPPAPRWNSQKHSCQI